MAKVKFSALVSDMRNKLNGSVFSKNRGGNYLRNKVTPVNPQTSFQSSVRASFAGISSNFRALTDAQIQAWNDAASSFPYVDIFGDSKILNGIQLFVKLNQNLSTVGLPSLDNAPAPVAVPSVLVASLSITIASGVIDLDTEIVGDGTGTSYVFEFTRPVSRGRFFLKNEFRVVSTQNFMSPELSPAQRYAAYVARFGVPVEGQRIGVRVHMVNNDTGQSSPGAVLTAVVV